MWKDKNDRVFGSIDEAADFYCAHSDACRSCPLYCGASGQCDNTHDEVVVKLGMEEITDPKVVKIAMFFGVGENAKAKAEAEVANFKRRRNVRDEAYNYLSGWPPVCCATVKYT